MRGLRLSASEWRLVIAGALLTVLAYPPFNLFFPSFLSLVPAVWLIVEANDDPRPFRRQMAQGFWFGLFAQGLVLYWMVIALWHFTALSALAYAATIIILGIFWGLTFAAVGWAVRRLHVSVVLAFPVFWTATDWGIGHLGDVSFPWLGLGVSLTGFPSFIQIADLVGSRGLTFLLAAANAALAVAWLRRRHRGWISPVVAVVGGIAVALAYGLWRERTIPVRTLGRVALIQPNVPYAEKWEQRLADSIFDDLMHLTDSTIDVHHPQLVLWPEAAMPGFIEREPQWNARIAEEARATKTPILAGGLDVRYLTPTDYEYWNSAFLYDTTGSRTNQPTYHKHYLVPIVERIPFLNPRWFRGMSQWFGGYGVGALGPVYRVGIGKFGVLICYESIFADLSRRYRRLGADFLVNITNDAWYGRTSAPYQHAAHLVLRAIENRVGIARAGNDGISEFIDPFGRTYDASSLEVRTTVTGPVTTSDAHTLYTFAGDWVGAGSVIAAVVLLVIGGWRRRRELSRPR